MFLLFIFNINLHDVLVHVDKTFIYKFISNRFVFVFLLGTHNDFLIFVCIYLDNTYIFLVFIVIIYAQKAICNACFIQITTEKRNKEKKSFLYIYIFTYIIFFLAWFIFACYVQKEKGTKMFCLELGQNLKRNELKYGLGGYLFQFRFLTLI